MTNGSHELSLRIVRRSKSNLAPALWALPRARRLDMVTFYAFCRVIDDIADEDDAPLEQRRNELARWRDGLEHGFDHPGDFQREVTGLLKKYSIPPKLLTGIVDGVTGDLEIRTFKTFDDLRAYCYKVASLVGLVSIEIFGYKNPACREYAVNLGYALQLTNILRDVGEDARRGRIYLPLEDLQRFGVGTAQVLELQFDEKMESLLGFEHERANRYYEIAAGLLPSEDRRRMLPAQIMAAIYGELLGKIRRKRFRIFKERITLGKLHKLAIMGKCAIRNAWGK